MQKIFLVESPTDPRKKSKNKSKIPLSKAIFPAGKLHRSQPGCLYVFGGEAVSLIPGAGFIPNSLNHLDGMLRAPRRMASNKPDFGGTE